MRRGTPSRRAIAVAATGSVGATIAPEREGRRPRQPVDQRVRDHGDRAPWSPAPARPRAARSAAGSARRSRRFAKKAAEYSSGGRKTTSTRSGSSSTSGHPRHEAHRATPAEHEHDRIRDRRSRARRPPARPRRRAARSRTSSTSSSSAHRLEADHPAGLGSATSPRSTSRSTWPSTSRQREERLRDRDVAPHAPARSRARSAAARRSARGSSRARRSCMAKRSSISAAWSPIGSPWPGRTISIGISRVSRIDSHVGQQRARALAGSPERRRAGAEISGLEEMCLIRWSPAIRIVAARASQKSVSEGECPGRCSTSKRAAGELELAAVVRAAA